MVYGIEGVVWVVEQDEQDSSATYLLQCNDSQIVIPHKTLKVTLLAIFNQ